MTIFEKSWEKRITLVNYHPNHWRKFFIKKNHGSLHFLSQIIDQYRSENHSVLKSPQYAYHPLHTLPYTYFSFIVVGRVSCFCLLSLNILPPLTRMKGFLKCVLFFQLVCVMCIVKNSISDETFCVFSKV